MTIKGNTKKKSDSEKLTRAAKMATKMSAIPGGCFSDKRHFNQIAKPR